MLEKKCNKMKKSYLHRIDFENDFQVLDDFDDWVVCSPGKSPWNKYMGLFPKIVTNDLGASYLRLSCEYDKEDKVYRTAGVKSIDTFQDGIIEIKARFKGGNSSWPAIWLKAYGASNYYEIDLCEYFERRNHCKTGLFMPKHLKWGLKRLFRPKKHPKIDKDNWNLFTCQWNSDSIIIKVNNKKVLEYKNTGNSKDFPINLEDRKFTLILSMQYGHSWCLPKNKKQLPLYMDVAYVKYYKLINNG